MGHMGPGGPPGACLDTAEYVKIIYNTLKLIKNRRWQGAKFESKQPRGGTKNIQRYDENGEFPIPSRLLRMADPSSNILLDVPIKCD